MSNKDKDVEQTGNKIIVPDNNQEHQVMLEEIWQNTSKLKKLFGGKLNKTEFAQFIARGRMHGANPFKNEIYPMKIKGDLQVVLARDYYRRRAQEQPEYAGHNVYGVHKGDKVIISSDEVAEFKLNVASEKPLIGAVAVGHRDDIDKPYTVFVRYDEYKRNNRMWKNKPLTMLKKVAEGQLLRAMFQGILGGTYMEGELPNDNNNQTADNDAEIESAEAIIIEDESSED